MQNETYNGYNIVIEPDTEPMDPRKEYDNAATMVCHHGRYNLGDDHNWSSPLAALNGVLGELLPNREDSLDQQSAFEELDKAPCTWLPLYLYDHSGITMSTAPFSCRWDSGQVGFIYISNRTLAKELGIIYGTGWEPDEAQSEKAIAMLKSEVSTYDDYLTGNVWQYRISKIMDDDETSEEVRYCGGFFGEPSHCLEAAKGEIGGEPEQTKQERVPSNLSDAGNFSTSTGRG